MSLLDRFRKAERQGKEAARQGMEKARFTIEEAQSVLRRKMRIHPRRRANGTAAQVEGPGPVAVKTEVPTQPSVGTQPELHTDEAPQSEGAQTQRTKPIVSVHGKDVDPGDIDKDAA